jgi:hypothetical protein
LVGKAKQDAERGVVAVNHYLEGVAPGSVDEFEMRLERLRQVLQSRNVRFVEYPEVEQLEALEQQEAQRLNLEFFKFSTDADMLEAIESSQAFETVS